MLCWWLNPVKGDSWNRLNHKPYILPMELTSMPRFLSDCWQDLDHNLPRRCKEVRFTLLLMGDHRCQNNHLAIVQVAHLVQGKAGIVSNNKLLRRYEQEHNFHFCFLAIYGQQQDTSTRLPSTLIN